MLGNAGANGVRITLLLFASAGQDGQHGEGHKDGRDIRGSRKDAAQSPYGTRDTQRLAR